MTVVGDVVREWRATTAEVFLPLSQKPGEAQFDFGAAEVVLQGVPHRISYDNSRIAVAKFVGKRGDTPTREFLRLQSHYLFEHHFCLVRRPMEKGHTENLIGFARRNFLVPVPRTESLEALTPTP